MKDSPFLHHPTQAPAIEHIVRQIAPFDMSLTDDECREIWAAGKARADSHKMAPIWTKQEKASAAAYFIEQAKRQHKVS